MRDDDANAAKLLAYDEMLARGDRVQVGGADRGAPDDDPGLEADRKCIEILRTAWPPVADVERPVRPAVPTLGDFRLLREIGCGGMGVVYEAEQLSMGRKVALKILPLATMMDPKGLARFKNEVRAVATLDHPHIVPIYSVGEERGVHYFAMRLIHGQSMARVIEQLRQTEPRLGADSIAAILIDSAEHASGRGTGSDSTSAADAAAAVGEADLSTLAAREDETGSDGKPRRGEFYRSVAELGVQAADALDCAHQHGVVHRDIKPANLMLDDARQLWITDFGLARMETDIALTMTGDVVGTLRYMSPEQAAGKRATVDHRTDIYSLGATLYELLTLEPVFAHGERNDLLRQIAEDAPRPPRRLADGLPRDVETIVLKALEKRPADRYETAQALAGDLQRFLAGAPIEAKRPGPLDRIAKWMRRHRALATSIAAALLVAVACLVVATVVIGKALQRTRAAQRHVLRERDTARDNLYLSNVRLAQQEWQNGNLTAVEELLDAHLPADGQSDLRGWEWYYLKSLCHRDLATLGGHTAEVQAVAWSPDGQQLASAGDDFVVRVWNAATHEELRVLRGHGDRVDALAWNPDGSRIASTGWDKTVRVWDVASGETVLEIPASDRVLRGVAWSPDGLRLATCGDDSLVKVWDAKSGKELAQMKGHIGLIWSIAWSPDGSHLASAGNYENRDIRIWDAGSGRQIRRIVEAHDHAVVDVAWSADGRQLATASVDQSARIWDAETGEQLQKIDAHDGTVMSVSWSPDGRRLATVLANDGDAQGPVLRIMEMESATCTQLPFPCSDRFTRYGRIAWSPDGRRIACSVHSSDGSECVTKVFDRATLAEIYTLGSAREVRSIAWSPNGTWLVSSGSNGMKIWSAAWEKGEME